MSGGGYTIGNMEDVRSLARIVRESRTTGGIETVAPIVQSPSSSGVSSRTVFYSTAHATPLYWYCPPYVVTGLSTYPDGTNFNVSTMATICIDANAATEFILSSWVESNGVALPYVNTEIVMMVAKSSFRRTVFYRPFVYTKTASTDKLAWITEILPLGGKPMPINSEGNPISGGRFENHGHYTFVYQG